jgi:hypothetical protein
MSTTGNPAELEPALGVRYHRFGTDHDLGSADRIPAVVDLPANDAVRSRGSGKITAQADGDGGNQQDANARASTHLSYLRLQQRSSGLFAN